MGATALDLSSTLYGRCAETEGQFSVESNIRADVFAQMYGCTTTSKSNPGPRWQIGLRKVCRVNVVELLGRAKS